MCKENPSLNGELKSTNRSVKTIALIDHYDSSNLRPMPYPSALEGDPKIIFFTDFDGTITLQDSMPASACISGPMTGADKGFQAMTSSYGPSCVYQ